MDKNRLKKALEDLKKNSPKRKFIQSYDLVFGLQNLDLKKPEQQLDAYVTMQYPRGKKVKVCAFVGPELLEESTKVCDMTIVVDDFPKYENKKLAKKLAGSYNFFIAQANIMAKVASTFGRILGPRNKMPNPKAGCVVPPKFQLKPLYDKLQRTVRVSARTALMAQCVVGNEEMKDDEVVDNIMNIYNQVVHTLPGHENNIKAMYIKLTMGKPIRVA